MKHYSFPHIGSFSQAVKSMQRHYRYIGKNDDGYPLYDELKELPTVKFIGTTKLHGTNTSIVVDVKSKEIYVQSRKRIITPGDDNYGFAQFASNLTFDELMANIPWMVRGADKFVIYGEWVGKGIQSKVAVTQLDKAWFVFAVRGINEGWDHSIWTDDVVSVPEKRVFFMPWYGEREVYVNLNDPARSEDELNNLMKQVEESCPVAKEFGVDGHGEGMVWHPDWTEKRYDYAFKVKGEKHSGGGEKKARAVQPLSAGEIAFVKETVTEERFDQGLDYLRETGDREVSVKRTGEFLSWLVNDILREESERLGNLNVSKIKKELGKAARVKFIDHVNKI